MAALDLMANTPIEASQAYLLFTDSTGNGCAYHVVKKKTLVSVIEALQGIPISSVQIGDRETSMSIDRLSRATIVQPDAREQLVQRAILTMACLTVVAVFATYAHLQLRYWRAGSELDEKIASVEVEAKAARTALRQRQAQIDQIDTIRHRKSSSVSVVRLLAEVTHLLPDSSWLTDFSSKANTLSITGYANSASELIAPLEASQLLASPEFSAPVTKVPGQQGERFTITATTGGV